MSYIGCDNVWLTAEELSSSLFEVGCRWVRRDYFLSLLSCVSFYQGSMSIRMAYFQAGKMELSLQTDDKLGDRLKSKQFPMLAFHCCDITAEKITLKGKGLLCPHHCGAQARLDNKSKNACCNRLQCSYQTGSRERTNKSKGNIFQKQALRHFHPSKYHVSLSISPSSLSYQGLRTKSSMHAYFGAYS